MSWSQRKSFSSLPHSEHVPCRPHTRPMARIRSHGRHYTDNTPVHGLYSVILAVPLPWVQSAVQSGTASRGPVILQEYPVFCAHSVACINDTYVGRAIHWRSFNYKSSCTGNWWKLWCLGRHVLYLRLCYQRLAAKGGCMERHTLRIYDWWLSSTTE